MQTMNQTFQKDCLVNTVQTLKPLTTLPVLQRKVTIGSAKDLYNYLSENFQLPTSSSGGITLKRRVYIYIPTDGRVQFQGKDRGIPFKLSKR